MLVEKTVFKNSAKDVATSDVVADFQRAGCELPLLLAIQGRQIDTTGDVNAVRIVGNALERALDSVVDGFHQAWAKLDRQWQSRPEDRIANSHTGYFISAFLFLKLATDVPVSS